jgi:ABC-type amino acid transport substrate-binding protein
LVVVAAACAKKTESGSSSSAASPTPVKTVKSGVLEVASCFDYPPFESGKAPDYVGFDIDMAKEIAKREGLTIEWVTHDFDTVFTALQANQFDLVAAASTITPEREQLVSFTDPYYASRQSLIVNTDQSPNVKSTDDLKSGDAIGVQKGTTGQMWAEKNLKPKGIQLKTYQTVTPMFQDLEAGGSIDGVVSDYPQAVTVAGTQFPSLAVVEPIETGENYGFAISQDNPDLLAAANKDLAAMIADGTYKTLFEKYFPGQELPSQYAPTG